MRSNWLVLRVLLTAVFALGLGTAHAQSTNSGDIRGTVTDATGALIPDVTVTVVNNDTGITKVLTTNKDGLYDTSSIVIGNYGVTFEKAGFAKFERSSISLEVGTSTVNATLKVGSTSDQVVVDTDNIPLLSTESGEQSTTLEAKTMAQLPQVTQDWENFVILDPGDAVRASAYCTTTVLASPLRIPARLRLVNCATFPYSNILADGASTTLSMSQNANPAVFETVAELQVTTSAFSAQYGIGGMIINQITKGGTSRFHGAAYNYLQNTALNAHPYGFGVPGSLLGPVPFLRYNNFGGNIGGPIDVPLCGT